MSLRKKLVGVAFALGLTLTFGAGAAIAQQPQGDSAGQQQQSPEGREFRRRKGRGMGGGFGTLRALRELNLTEAQQQQARIIMERFVASIEPQRAQLKQLREQGRDGEPSADVREKAKQLREQIHQSEQNMRTEILALLTQEQRTRLDQIEAERKARRDQMRERRRKQNGEPEIR